MRLMCHLCVAYKWISNEHLKLLRVQGDEMPWERIPRSWTSVGKGTFTVGWQFLARDETSEFRARHELQSAGDDVLRCQNGIRS